MITKPTDEEVREFLQESNAIEGVYSDECLEDAIWAWGFLHNRTEEHGKLHWGHVLQTHEILMRNNDAWDDPSLKNNYLGVIRDCRVYVGMKQLMRSDLIPAALEDWCDKMNVWAIGDEEHSQFLHVKYEEIHPFIDGNGRTGRIFWNWHRLRNELPLKIIHAGPEQMEYYKIFK